MKKPQKPKGGPGLSYRGVNVKAIRGKLDLSQSEFAIRFGLSVDDIKKWEAGDTHPTGCARVLLTVIAREPDAVTRTLNKSMSA